MNWVPTVFALLCAAAGWYYLLHAGSAARLEGLERQSDNRLRIRLRRWGGAGMVLIGIAFYVAFRIADRQAEDHRGSPVLVALCLFAIVLLLPVVLFLAWIDMRLTRKMRDALRQKKRTPPQ